MSIARKYLKPRPGMEERVTWLGETWIEPEELAYNTPYGSASESNRRGLVRFPDGRLRRVRLGVPDSYFTIPARPDRTRIGFVMVVDGEFRFFRPSGGDK
jgi:hypothetical protein